MNCPICDQINAARIYQNPNYVAELQESFVVLADDQYYEGYCILLLKDHEDHLVQLSSERQLRLFNDVIQVARAIQEVFSPARLNYECLGNTLSHIHWHVIPRYTWDPNPKGPIWGSPKQKRIKELTPEYLKSIVAKLQKVLTLGNVSE